jgi:hypothetical protein
MGAHDPCERIEVNIGDRGDAEQRYGREQLFRTRRAAQKKEMASELKLGMRDRTK